jgi:hypothetical protein
MSARPAGARLTRTSGDEAAGSYFSSFWPRVEQPESSAWQRTTNPSEALTKAVLRIDLVRSAEPPHSLSGSTDPGLDSYPRVEEVR